MTESITPAHVDLALERTDQFQINDYDALVLSAARLAECEVVFSEDLNPGQDYAGIRVENPLPHGASG